MKKIHIPLLLLLLAVSSCKKFLEERTQSEVVPKTAAALNELLLGEGYNFSVTASVILDDDVEHIYSATEQTSFNEFTWQRAASSTGMFRAAYWGQWYKIIQICNTVIEYSADVTGTQQERDYVKGQALLLRAYAYFNLVNLYALPYTDALNDPGDTPGVPLILEAGASLEQHARNSVADVYQQMVRDVTHGTVLLEQLKKTDGIGRINHAAGYLLASRIYLHMGKWQECIQAATKSLSFKSILMNLNTWGTANPAASPIVANQNMESVWEFSTPVNYAFALDYRDYVLSQDLLALFEPGDLRTSIYFNGSEQLKTIPANPPNPGITGQAFRVSEAYLNRAEANAQLFLAGDPAPAAQALNDLNLLRENRFSEAQFQPLATTDANELLQWCRNEKRREFFREESHRWFDLRRYGMPELTHVFWKTATVSEIYKLKERDAAYVREIPAAALELNQKLEQNPAPPTRLPE